MKSIIVTLVLLLSVTLLFAHGGEKHVMGTVAKVSDSSIVVKDVHGNNLNVSITSTTKFMKDGKAATVKDVQAGDRIVVHARQNGKMLEATMVKMGSMNDRKGLNMHEGKNGIHPTSK